MRFSENREVSTRNCCDATKCLGAHGSFKHLSRCLFFGGSLASIDVRRVKRTVTDGLCFLELATNGDQTRPRYTQASWQCLQLQNSLACQVPRGNLNDSLQALDISRIFHALELYCYTLLDSHMDVASTATWLHDKLACTNPCECP